MTPIFKRLEARLALAVGVGLMAFALVAGVFTYGYSYRNELAFAESLQQQLVRTVQAQAEVAAFAANHEIATGVLGGLMANPIILAVRIETPRGFTVERGAGKADFDRGTRYALFSPVDQTESIGHLIVIPNAGHVERSAARTAIFQVLLMLVLVILAAGMMAFVLRTLMIDPIVRIIAALGAITPGSANRLEIDGRHAGDEIGLLAKTANALLEAAELAIREERAARAMQEAISRIARIGGWELQLDTRTLTFSEDVYRVHGHDAGRPVALDQALSALHEDSRTALSRAVDEAIWARTAFDLELQWRNEDAVPQWVRVQGQYRVAGDGRECLIGAVQDITERKQNEAKLRDSEERFSKAFHSSPIASSIARASDGTFIDVNNNFERDFGWRREDLVGRTSLDMHLWPNEDARRTWIASLMREGRVVNWEALWLHKNGEYRDVSISSETVDIRGTLCVLAFIVDTTARKRAEEDLLAAKRDAELASQTKSRFLAAASHDLRQPIQAINLFVHALDRTELSDEQKQISNYITRASQSLGELLNALLDISRLDSGSIKPAIEEILIEDLFRELDAKFSPVAMSKRLRFILHFPVGEHTIRSDRKLLLSLIDNLVGNAIKYTRKGGVLIAFRPRGADALIQVWDTGIGIPADQIGRIYDEYFQIGNPERDTAKGLGLGLSIVRNLSRILGTAVAVRSVPGRGSVFEFRLPLISSPARHVPVDATKGDGDRALSAWRVILVEDHGMVAEAMRLSLKSLGMAVTVFDNGEEALASPEIADADFYISDFRLPGMNGMQLLEAIRDRCGHPIRAVLLTGDKSPGRTAMFRGAPWTVLYKPVDLAMMLAAMKAQETLPEGRGAAGRAPA